MRDRETDRLYRRFDFPIGNGNRKVLILGNEIRVADIRVELTKYTAGLPEDTTAANAFISDLIKNAPMEVKGTAKGGWKPDALRFVSMKASAEKPERRLHAGGS